MDHVRSSVEEKGTLDLQTAAQIIKMRVCGSIITAIEDGRATILGQVDMVDIGWTIPTITRALLVQTGDLRFVFIPFRDIYGDLAKDPYHIKIASAGSKRRRGA